MLEKALSGGRGYWALVISLLAISGIGVIAYLYQLEVGLGVTGLCRDVTWGLYIGQFTFLVGVAASAVMLVIPYYLHDYKKFGKIIILGKFLAVACVIMCMLFIFVDMGQPWRILNLFLYISPHSPMFWDATVLAGYLSLNIVTGWVVLQSDKKGVKAPSWVMPLIYISIPWAISIHTVTAFLFAGLPGRDLWMSALLAAHFLASAFAVGPSLLILLALGIRKFTKFNPGKEAIAVLGKIVTYAMSIYLFFWGLKLFTWLFSQKPGYLHVFQFLFVGIGEYNAIVPIVWAAVVMAVTSVVLLMTAALRKNEKILALACILVFVSLWIEKGFVFVVGGFAITPFKTIIEYWPTLPEIVITIGVWAIGFLILTILYKIAVSVREEEIA
ncbi:polysulfide reductase NrfD [Thermodesulfovibrionales bacterium]|nr:polysulfide reductase NrfD [Thermodesulfovibrionales bacterium]